MRERDHRVDLALQLRKLLARGDDRRRIEHPRTPARVDRQADDPQPDRPSAGLDGHDRGAHCSRKWLAVHVGYVAGDDAKTALREARAERGLGDVELVIAEHGPIDADLIQHVHHLTAGQRLTVDDRRADCRRRKIVAAQASSALARAQRLRRCSTVAARLRPP